MPTTARTSHSVHQVVSHPPVAATQRSPALEGVRGLAAILVAGYHTLHFGPQLSDHVGLDLRLLRKLLETGWVGVDLFFVLSGFLITRILLRMQEELGWIRAFYLRRAARILPVYFVVLCVCLWLLPACFANARDPALAARHDGWWYATFLHNFLNLRDSGWPAGNALIGNLWSLAVEEQFYLIWPWIVALTRRRYLIPVCCGILVIIPMIRCLMVQQGFTYDAIYSQVFCRADTLVAGALICALIERGHLISSTAIGGSLLLGGAALFALAPRLTQLTLGVDDAYTRANQFTWILMSWSGLLLIALNGRTWMARLLSWRLIRFMGFHSYSFYLISFPLCFLAGEWCKGHGIVGSWASLGLFGLATTFLSLALAIGSWHGLERRCLRLTGSTPVFRP